ncbi:MAG: DUF1573 domain-containing protein, partial [Proteobacteria bacterium]|nr:DUF1573 domain-containing protein [Pseudomonadota bacterium]
MIWPSANPSDPEVGKFCRHISRFHEAGGRAPASPRNFPSGVGTGRYKMSEFLEIRNAPVRKTMRNQTLFAALAFFSATWPLYPLTAKAMPAQPRDAAKEMDEEEIATEITEEERAESDKDSVLRAARQVHLGQIRFDENSFDFGRVKRGEKLGHRFTFKNIGKGPLKVHGVHASCGCTAAEVKTDKEYSPQEAGAIDITFDTTDFTGSVVKTVTVMTNERHVPDRTLSIRATVVSEFEVNPPLADFGQILTQNGGAQQVFIKPQPGYRINIEKIKFNSEALQVSSTIKDGGYVLNVELKKNIAPGFLKETIYVKNNSKSLPELRIPVRATIRGNIEIEPRYLEFGAISPTDKSSRSVTVTGLQDFEVKNVRMDLNLNGTKIQDTSTLLKVNPVSTDKLKKLIAIDLMNKTEKAGSVHGRLFIETTDP